LARHRDQRGVRANISRESIAARKSAQTWHGAGGAWNGFGERVAPIPLIERALPMRSPVTFETTSRSAGRYVIVSA